MRGLVQRVVRASVTSEGVEVGAVGPGLCVLVGVTHADTEAHAAKLAAKLWHLRIFDDEAGVMNRSVADTTRAVLVVSQFTLLADTRKGNRPSFIAAAPPEVAEPLYETFVEALRALGLEVATGRFGRSMQVALVNDGPVTIVM